MYLSQIFFYDIVEMLIMIMLFTIIF